MGWGHATALAIFASYFLIIIGLFALILRSLRILRISHTNRGLKTCWIFGFFTLASLTHTWLHMFRFLDWSFTTYEANLRNSSNESIPALTRLTSWLIDTSLFEQAWAAVCFGPFNWWWSQQLCLYTVGAWTIFLATDGRMRHVKHVWAYMLLGQLVAISVASNLFYLALLLTPSSTSGVELKGKSKSKDKPLVSVSPVLYLPVLLSLATIAYSPYTSVASGTFLPNLLLMHTLIVIPLVARPSSIPMLPNIRLRTFAGFLSAISLFLHAHTTVVAFRSVASGEDLMSALNNWRSLVASAWETLQTHHPAQSSIGWDVVWTTASFVIWTLLGSSREEATQKSGGIRRVLASLITPFWSVGAVAPWVFGWGGEHTEAVKEE